MVKLRTVGRYVVEGLSLVVLLVLCAALYACERRGVSYKRGFFCDDKSIRLPYKSSTVPTYALAIVCLCIPVIIILCESFEGILRSGLFSSKQYLAVIRSSWFIRMLNLLKWYLCGILITLIATSSGKLAVGRLRPNFLDVCQANFSQIECYDASGGPLYVTDFKCYGDQELIIDARLSWPSGHSSTTAYACVFFAAYLFCLRLLPVSGIFKLLLMLVSLMIALLTGLSRVSDHKHHPTDVLSGWILGGVVATAIVASNFTVFKPKRQCPKRRQYDGTENTVQIRYSDEENTELPQ